MNYFYYADSIMTVSVIYPPISFSLLPNLSSEGECYGTEGTLSGAVES
jgi:hypothetical protein